MGYDKMLQYAESTIVVYSVSDALRRVQDFSL